MAEDLGGDLAEQRGENLQFNRQVSLASQLAAGADQVGVLFVDGRVAMAAEQGTPAFDVTLAGLSFYSPASIAGTSSAYFTVAVAATDGVTGDVIGSTYTSPKIFGVTGGEPFVLDPAAPIHFAGNRVVLTYTVHQVGAGVAVAAGCFLVAELVRAE